MPLNLTPNSNFLTLLRLDVSCGADLASDSRPLPLPCPGLASFHTPEPDIQSHPAPPHLPSIPGTGFSASVLTVAVAASNWTAKEWKLLPTWGLPSCFLIMPRVLEGDVGQPVPSRSCFWPHPELRTNQSSLLAHRVP